MHYSKLMPVVKPLKWKWKWAAAGVSVRGIEGAENETL